MRSSCASACSPASSACCSSSSTRCSSTARSASSPSPRSSSPPSSPTSRSTVLGTTHGFRLTMAGVTGLIVAIGVTADSFIVYFERIRDEVRDGRPLVAAVETGWKRARRTIIAADARQLHRGRRALLPRLEQRPRLRVHARPDDAHRPARRHPLHPPDGAAAGPHEVLRQRPQVVGSRPAAPRRQGVGPLPRPRPVRRADPAPSARPARPWRSARSRPEGKAQACSTSPQVGNDLYTGKRSIDFIGRQKTWYAISARPHRPRPRRHLRSRASTSASSSAVARSSASRASPTARATRRRRRPPSPRPASPATSSRRHRRRTPSACRPRRPADRTDEASAALAQPFGVDEGDGQRLAHRAELGAVGQPAGDPGADRLPHPRDARHGALLPHLEDGRRRPRRPAARPRHHRRHLRALRVRDHAVVDDRLPHDPRVLALRHRRRLRQGPREHRGGVPHQAR